MPRLQTAVHVRAGEKKRWHFAHKNLSDCPLRHESLDVLQARSLLYRWLKTKFGDKVTIEKHFLESTLPRPLDCYVVLSANKLVGYWSGIFPPDRRVTTKKPALAERLQREIKTNSCYNLQHN